MKVRNVKLLAYIIGTLALIALAGLVTLLEPENILFHIICFILFLFRVLFCILVLLDFILAQVLYKIALRQGQFNTQLQKSKHKAYFELSGEKLKEKN